MKPHRGNTISGNNGPGVQIRDAGTMDNSLHGNNIGTDVPGNNALPNAGDGVLVSGGASVWKLRNSNAPGPPDITPFAYGGPNVLPITGDFNFPAQPLLAADGPGPGAADSASRPRRG